MSAHRSLLSLAVRLRHRARGDERGLTTAELLGNAALGVFALVAIWAALEALGLEIVEWIQEDILRDR